MKLTQEIEQAAVALGKQAMIVESTQACGYVGAREQLVADQAEYTRRRETLAGLLGKDGWPHVSPVPAAVRHLRANAWAWGLNEFASRTDQNPADERCQTQFLAFQEAARLLGRLPNAVLREVCRDWDEPDPEADRAAVLAEAAKLEAMGRACRE